MTTHRIPLALLWALPLWAALLSATGCDEGSTPAGDKDGAPDRGAADVGRDGMPSDAMMPYDSMTDGMPPDAITPHDSTPHDSMPYDMAPDATPPGPPPPAPLITEFMASNRGALFDEDGASSDWIELYNPHPMPIELAGFGLSDRADGADAWILPPRTLASGAYLVVFASGADRRPPEGPLHTHFRLDADGEPLTLVAPGGAVIQGFDPAPQQADVAYGLPATALVAPGAEARISPPGPDGWQAPAYDDSSWLRGPTGVGRDPGGPPSALDRWAPALASHWTFDQLDEGPDGLRVQDALPGSPRHLTLADGARLTDGREGQALTGGWAAAAAAEGFDFGADFTWALWMRGGDRSGALISRNAPGIAWSRGAKALFVRRGTLQFDAGWVGNPDSRTPVVDSAWHHVAATWRAADDRLVLYVDGQPRFDAPFEMDAFPEDLDDPPVRSGFFLGRAHFSGGLPDLGPYDGRIDDVSVWTAALPPEAVAQLAAGAPMPSVGPFAGLIATPLPDETGARLRLPFEVGPGLAAAVLRLRFDDRVAAWIDGEPVAAAFDSPRDDRRAVTPLDAPVPLPAVGPHLLAVEGAADAADLARWVVLPELWGLRAEPAPLVRATPGALNSEGRSPPVAIDPPGGVVLDELSVALSTPGGAAAIHYTLDGRPATAADPIYAGPIALDGPATVRAVAITEGRAPGAEAVARFTALDPALAGFTSTVPVLLVDRGGEGPPPRAAYGDALLAAWMPGPDGLTRLADAPVLVSRAAIRVRGQSSANAPKAPYRLELRDAEGRDRAEPLLGLPADADWVLHGPFTDKSLVRNALVYSLGREMGLTAPRAALCELYLRAADGRVVPDDSRGVYLLVERIELGPERLDLPSIEPADAEPPAVTGGWLLKFEAGASEEPRVPGWDSLEAVDPADPTPAQMAWVEDAVATLHEALHAPGFDAPDAPWRALVDLPSAVDLVIVNELFRDQDAYVRSAYMHKDREGPWVMGPLWDYNLVAGTGGFFANTATTGWQLRQQWNTGEHGWFARMMDDPAFAEAVAMRWRALRAGILSDAAMAARVDALTAALAGPGGPAERNFAVWRNLGSGRVNGFVSPVSQTWEGQLDALLDWLARRSAWLDGQLAE